MRALLSRVIGEVQMADQSPALRAIHLKAAPYPGYFCVYGLAWGICKRFNLMHGLDHAYRES
jgi:hypothetical protein